MESIDQMISDVRCYWRPAPRRRLSEWSDKYAFLSAESSASEGNWTTLSYQREPMDAMTDPRYDTVVVKKSARIGYTKMLNNLIAYHIHQDPCSIMVVQPTIEDAEGYSKEELAPMFRDTPCLAGLVADSKQKVSNNTILSKSYPGGTLSIVGANSPRGFRRVSRRVVVFDEINGYPPSAGDEGDQIKLGSRRAEYYWNRKIVMGSTPTIVGHSKIDTEFEKTDMRMYYVPCPGCGHMQTLRWANFKWPKGKPNEVKYQCESCERLIDNSEKFDMFEKGEWRATRESNKPNLVGFFIWTAYSYSPNARWSDLACEFVDAIKDPLTKKTFINTVLGEAYEETGERIDSSGLMVRCEPMSEEILPTGCHMITVGVDVQGDRLELEYVGWGRGEETWSLGYKVINGDPVQSTVWSMLDLALQRTWVHQSGVRIMSCRTFIDSSNGSHMSRIYDYARPRQCAPLNISACKGASTPKPAICGQKSYQKKYEIDLFIVGTVTCKELIYARLNLPEHGPGYMHFPIGYDQKYFDMLTAEEMIYKKGVKTYRKIRARNEAIDCRVYATAAIYSFGVKIDDIIDAIEAQSQNTASEREFRSLNL
jgi:phage terminase large subunit GpA-like protein